MLVKGSGFLLQSFSITCYVLCRLLVKLKGLGFSVEIFSHLAHLLEEQRSTSQETRASSKI